jgi:hypothetical protein
MSILSDRELRSDTKSKALCRLSHGRSHKFKSCIAQQRVYKSLEIWTCKPLFFIEELPRVAEDYLRGSTLRLPGLGFTGRFCRNGVT